MTRIDFYHNVDDRLLFACRLVRKAYKAGQSMVVWCADRSRLHQFDHRLWTFNQQEFIPHVRADDADAPHTPVLLADNPALELPHHALLLNLDDQCPPIFSRFERLFEVVSTEAQDRLAARHRWQFYRDRGYALTGHDQTNTVRGAG